MVEESKRWPIHLQPKDDELLSSWLVRLANAYGLTPNVFYSLTISGKQNFPTHVDETTDQEILWLLVEKTGLTLDRVKATTLVEYEKHLFSLKYVRSQVPWQMTYQWVLPISNYKYSKLYGLQFCPICLSEDEVPYFRRKWRLAFVTICENHRVLLLDCCNQCGEPINFRKNASRITIKSKNAPILECYSCNYDMRTVPSKRKSPAITTDSVRFQEHLINGLLQGWSAGDQNIAFSMGMILAAMHMLVRLIAFGELGTFLRKTLSMRYRIPMFTVAQLETYKCVELLRVAERLRLLGMARRLFAEWPADIIAFHKQNPQDWDSDLPKVLFAPLIRNTGNL